MDSVDQIAMILQGGIPGFQIESLVYIDEGDENEVYEVNQDYIFRFPKNESASENLQREMQVLPVIEGYLDLPVPHFEYLGKKSALFNKVFVGYKKIKGIPLANEVFEQLTPLVQESVLQQLASFLIQLHRFPVQNLPSALLDTIDYRSEYETIYQKIQATSWPDPYRYEQNLIVKFFEKFLGQHTNFVFQSCLIHNDISFDHIYYDPATGRLAGIIDFGDMAIGDGIYDCKRILDNYSFSFLQRLLNYYQPYNSQLALKKLFFYRLARVTRDFACVMARQQLQEAGERWPFLHNLIQDYMKVN